MKILIIGPSWVGDMVMSQSLYMQLKQQHANAQIDVLAPSWCLPILARMPQVNRAIAMPVGHGKLALKERWQIAKQLKSEQYQRAYVLPNSAKSALIPLFARIPTRCGWKGEMRYGLLNDLRANKEQFAYMVERYVALAFSKESMLQNSQLATIFAPELTIDKENQRQCLAKFAIDTKKPIVGLCPGAEFGVAKRWPEEHYAQVARELIAQGNQVLLFGSANDAVTTGKICAQLENSEHIFDLAGKTALNDAVDLLAACHTVFSNDSGLMHVAAAVGCKIVAIYGSSSPRYTPPLTQKVRIAHTDIACRPCFKRECPFGHTNCLTQLSPDVVLNHYDLLSTEFKNETA
ncbi:MAG: lipopolysaccharide heptosyltransferase II [Enterovibrio sp.]